MRRRRMWSCAFYALVSNVLFESTARIRQTARGIDRPTHTARTNLRYPEKKKFAEAKLRAAGHVYVQLIKFSPAHTSELFRCAHNAWPDAPDHRTAEKCPRMRSNARPKYTQCVAKRTRPIRKGRSIQENRDCLKRAKLHNRTISRSFVLVRDRHGLTRKSATAYKRTVSKPYTIT